MQANPSMSTLLSAHVGRRILGQLYPRTTVSKKNYLKTASYRFSVPNLLALCTLLPTPPAGAIVEAEFRRVFDQQALPLVLATPAQTFAGVGGVKIAYRVIPAAPESRPRGGVVFVHGYSESMLKHSELIYDLSQAGYHVFAMDLRGMGESQRLLGNPQIGHVERFSDYVDDLEYFVRNIVQPKHQAPLYLAAHSLGGMVSVAMLARGNTNIKAAALSAPMFGIKTRGFLPWLVRAVVQFNIWRGAGTDYIPGSGDYDPHKANVRHNVVTHSLVRAGRTLALYQAMPKLVVAGQSNEWIAASFQAADSSIDLAPKVNVPIKIYQAAEDAIVSPEAQQAFCSKAPQCELSVVNQARHEVLQEVDAVRSPVLQDILNFFN